MLSVETSLESSALVGIIAPPLAEPLPVKLSEVIPSFIRYAQFEQTLSSQTVQKYQESLNWVVRDLGDVAVKSLDLGYITVLKQKIISRGAGPSRVASITFALKSFLKYCGEVLELPVLDFKKVKAPRMRRREVLYLTNEEIQQFVSAIKFENNWNGKTRRRCVRMDGLRLRTLVEVLLGSGMRISEALSLNRDSINFERAEAKIIGKGSKERIVFFSKRSLDWVKFYLENRTDSGEPLFITKNLTRLCRADVSKLFQWHVRKSGLTKKVTPHILRHTMATNLLFNGCPISHVKEILGHDRLETTCRYYLGLDKSKAKEAHGKYLSY